jgi:hypothetical protein
MRKRSFLPFVSREHKDQLLYNLGIGETRLHCQPWIYRHRDCGICVASGVQSVFLTRHVIQSPCSIRRLMFDYYSSMCDPSLLGVWWLNLVLRRCLAIFWISPHVTIYFKSYSTSYPCKTIWVLLLISAIDRDDFSYPTSLKITPIKNKNKKLKMPKSSLRCRMPCGKLYPIWNYMAQSHK